MSASIDCRRCGGPVEGGARFCVHCGVRLRTVPHPGSPADAAKTIRAVGVLFAGVLGAVLAGGAASRFGEAAAVAATEGMAIVATVLALAFGPRMARSEFLPFGLRPQDVPWIPLAAGLALGVGWLYLEALGSVVGTGPGDAGGGTILVVAAVVLAPVVEETACRGVLHALLARVTTPNAVLVLTSVLFALLHGLNGAVWFELPHRFVAGLLFGLLRRHSGGLSSPMLAHALLNLAATLL